MPRFEEKTVRRFAAAEEIEIEARSGSTGTAIRTPIWVVVSGSDVYVRAGRGTRGRWYRSATSDANAAVILGGERVRVRPVAVREKAEINRVTESYRQKYGNSQWVDGVLKPHTLEATLRLEPAS